LATHAAAGLDAVRLLRAMKPGFTSLTTSVSGNVLTVSGQAYAPDPALANSLAVGFPRVTPPDSGGYLRCLGDLLGPDIRLCPQFGLNVHGKGLYVVPFDVRDIRVITGRNVHEHLIGFVGDTYRAWAARQSDAAGALSLNLDGRPVPLAADGSFSFVMPSGGRTSRLVIATSAGDATGTSLRGARDIRVSGRGAAAAEGQAGGWIRTVQALQPAAENLDAGLPTRDQRAEHLAVDARADATLTARHDATPGDRVDEPFGEVEGTRLHLTLIGRDAHLGNCAQLPTFAAGIQVLGDVAEAKISDRRRHAGRLCVPSDEERSLKSAFRITARGRAARRNR